MTDVSTAKLSPPGGRLTIARPTSSHWFICQGDRVRVTADDREGVRSIYVDTVCATRELRTDFGPCSNVLITPGTARRELLGPEGVVLEDIFALPRLPGVLVQWTPLDGRPFSVSLRWICPSGCTPERNQNRMHLTPADTQEHHTVFRIEPEPENWSADRNGSEWEIFARVEVPAGETLSWVVGAAPKMMIAEAAVAAIDLLAPQEAVQGGWLQELETEHLRTRTGILQIDSALEWAKARASGHDSPTLSRLLAQLGAGLMREAGSTLDGLAEAPSPDFGRGLGAYLMWSGEHGAPSRYRTALREWIGMGAITGADPKFLAGTTSVAGNDGAHVQLIEALDGLGYAEEAGAVRALALPSSGKGKIILPMAGGSPAGVAQSDPEATWLRFRELTELCSNGKLTASPDRATDPAYALIRILVEDILQAKGEASLGRLTIAPCLPEHLRSFQVDGIRLGRSGVDFRVDRDGDTYRYRFQPTSGAMPLNLTFEPSLLGVALQEARVDGAPAELDWGEAGDRITPRLQLPVDRERTVELQVKREETG